MAKQEKERVFKATVKPSKRSNKPKVSVIIPIRKGENIDLLLGYIDLSTYDNIERIVVDEGLERSEQRNIGITRATGEYLLILDSDQLPDEILIQECVDLMKLYDALYIPEIIVTKGWFARIRDWERQFYTGTYIDCVRFVRAKHCPGFDTDMSGPEDADWDRRVSGSRYITSNVLYHLDNVGVVNYFRKKAYYAKSMGVFNKKYPSDLVTSLWWRCFGVFFENGKWKRVLKAPHMFVAVMIILFIRGIIYVVNK